MASAENYGQNVVVDENQPRGDQDTPPGNTGMQTWRSAVRGAWLFVSSPWLILVLSLLLVLLLALTWVLPQLPGQLSSEAGAAERWLATATAARGGLGGLLRSLGLFQIMHSPLLQLLLALLLFVLLVQLARLLWAAYVLRKVPDVLDTTRGVNGAPLPIATTGTLLRWRLSHPAPPLPLAGELQRLLDARLRRVDRRTARVAVAPLPAPDEHAAQSAAPAALPLAEPPALVLEERLLAVQGLNAAAIRPLLVLGMLAALALVWVNAVFGWEYTVQQLAPGERSADAVHDLKFEYHLEQPALSLLQPALVATIGSDTVSIPVTQEMQEDVGGVVVRAEPGAPGLLVQTVDGALLLARPGQAAPVAEIGLGFPSIGSEETLLLPQQAVGLRIVRMEQGRPGPAEDGFLVEVFQGGSEQAVSRISIDRSEIVAIPIFSGEVLLAMTPLPSLNVQVRHGPGYWLLWPALALLGLGALGFARQPGFVLAQVGPWPPERSVVTIQSDLPAEMASLRRWYSEQQTAPARGQKHSDNQEAESKEL